MPSLLTYDVEIAQLHLNVQLRVGTVLTALGSRTGHLGADHFGGFCALFFVRRKLYSLSKRVFDAGRVRWVQLTSAEMRWAMRV